jgi:transposase InsO family protein
VQFNGGTDQPQVRATADADDGAVHGDPGEEALPECPRYARCASAERAERAETRLSATAPNQKWATDVTEFNVNGDKLYLSACMDLYNGEIVAHKMARHPVGCQHAAVALSRTECTAGLIVHSDQGWHYKMQPYRAMLAQRGVKQSKA